MLKATAVAAATGAAAFAARRALSGDGDKSAQDDDEGSERMESRRGSQSKGGSGAILGSMFSGGWDAARDALLPLAEDAAGAAGKFLAESGPDIVREHIVPRFIDAFNEAQDS